MKRFPARFHAAWIVFAFCSALLLFSAVSAGATTSYDVWKPDGTGGFTNPPYPGSYVVIDVTLLNPTTAEISAIGQNFTTAGLANNYSGTYRFGSEAALDLNVNATGFTVSGISNDWTTGNAKNVNSFGTFNLLFNGSGAWKDSATSFSFTVNDISGTWSSSSDVLALNNKDWVAAAHVLVPNAQGSAAAVTGYAAAPIPSGLFLLAPGLAGLAIFRKKLKS